MGTHIHNICNFIDTKNKVEKLTGTFNLILKIEIINSEGTWLS